MLMTSVMSRENKAARMPIGCPQKAAGFSHSKRKLKETFLPIPSLVEMNLLLGRFRITRRHGVYAGGRERLIDEYNNKDVLPYVHKGDMAGRMDSIK